MSTYVINGVTLTEAQARSIASQVQAKDRQRRDTYKFPFKHGTRVVLCRNRGMSAELGQLATVMGNTPEWLNDQPLVNVSWDRRSGTTQNDGGYFVEDFRRATAADEAAFKQKCAPPKFAVGDWVQRTYSPWVKAAKVVGTGCDLALEGGSISPNLVRHATPEEIAAAKRIEPKVGLIVCEIANGRVLQYEGASYGWRRLDTPHRDAHYMGELTTDHYTILDSYTVRGVR